MRDLWFWFSEHSCFSVALGLLDCLRSWWSYAWNVIGHKSYNCLMCSHGFSRRFWEVKRSRNYVYASRCACNVYASRCACKLMQQPEVEVLDPLSLWEWGGEAKPTSEFCMDHCILKCVSFSTSEHRHISIYTGPDLFKTVQLTMVSVRW